jgi:hypothetical protein
MTIDMAGMRCGRFTVLARVAGEPKIPAWRCRCDCGTTKVVRGCDLRQGKIKSCGCWRSDRSRQAMSQMNKQRLSSPLECLEPGGERPAALRRGVRLRLLCGTPPPLH